MRHIATMIVPPALLLGACSSQPEVTAQDASIADVTEKARDAVKLEPGQWRTETEIVSVDVPGMPPEVAAAMKQQMGAAGTQRMEACVTKEDAERPPAALLGSGDNACRYERFAMKGGQMNAVMACRGAGGGAGTMRMTVAGSYGGSAYDMTGTMEMAMGQKMTVRTRIKGARIGECPA